jgi:hypothetical protein
MEGSERHRGASAIMYYYICIGFPVEVGAVQLPYPAVVAEASCFVTIASLLIVPLVMF